MIPMSEKPPQEELHEYVESIAEGVRHEMTASRHPWYHLSHAGSILLIIYTIQLSLFGVLIWLVHIYPVNPIDITITREFQENPTAWLKMSMEVVSYPGSTFVLPCLVLLAAVIFWLGGLRLEAAFVVALSLLSLGMNTLVKILVAHRTARRIRAFCRANWPVAYLSGRSLGQRCPGAPISLAVFFWASLSGST